MGSPRCGPIRLSVLVTCCLVAIATAQEPKYPRTNLATVYVVDPAWPKRVEGINWGEMSGIAVDARDQVWIFTRGSMPVQCYDAKGQFVAAWGGTTIGKNGSHHLRIDRDGNVWVADITDHVVQKYTPTGVLLLTLGIKGEAGRDQAHLNLPTDVAIGPEGDVFVSDGYGNNRIVHFTKDGKFVKEWGSLGVQPGQFSIPHSIAADSKGRLYVADRNNARVQVFDPSGKFLAEWRNLVVPWGITVNRKDEIWVCGSSPMQWRATDEVLGVPPKDQVFIKFSGDGRVLQLVSVPKGVDGLERPGECNWAHAIAEDSQGNLYVGDIMGKRAQKFVRRQP
jgi:DNA-binding beta-propeller fold protein YncE